MQVLKWYILRATKRHLKMASTILCIVLNVQYQIILEQKRQNCHYRRKYSPFYFVISSLLGVWMILLLGFRFFFSFYFFSLKIILYFILNPNQWSKTWKVIISLTLNTVCLLNELTALPWKQPFTNKHAGSDLATMSRLCKHLIITIKLSTNIHYCSLFKR